MSRHRSSYVVYESDESSDDYPPPIQVERPKGKVVRLGSEYGGSQRSHKSKKITIRDSSPAPVVVENFLSIPNQRPRASSTGAAPQPNYVPVYIQGSQSGSPNRHKHYHHHHHDSESDDSFYSGSRGRRRPSSHRGSIDWETQQQLAKLKLKEEQEARDAAEAAALAKYEDRQRRQSEQTKQALLEAEDKRKRDKDELEARIAAAEAKRKREEAEEKEHRIQIIREEREREEKKKKDDEEMRKRILREEDERVEKEKAKKKKEEDEFNQKVKERFMKAGYDPEYIEAILAEKKKKNKDELAIDLSRPTYIRVQRKHLHPDTLDFYCLPWEYDSADSRYIIIKKYVSHDLQQELFRHTEKIRITKEQRLLTDGTGYTKETITTLKPTDVYKDKDKDDMYIVRRKSTSGRSRSRSVSRRSWMFT